MVKIIGKVGPRDLEKFVFQRTGSGDKKVSLGPKYGEDAAVVKIGDNDVVVSSDPIVFAADKIGKLGVHIVCNDIYASGVRPRWLLDIIFLPEVGGKRALDKITKQLDSESKKLGVAIIGGHSEYIPSFKKPFLALTAFGITGRDESISTSGAKEGDLLLLTKSAGLEVSGILASDFYKELNKMGISIKVLREARKYLEEISIGVEAIALSKIAHAMHDPTEGGVLAGAQEMAISSGRDLEMWKDKIPVENAVDKICKAVKINPLKCFSSGALLAAISKKDEKRTFRALNEKNIPVSVIGRFLRRSKSPVIYFHREKGKTEKIKDLIKDEFYDIWDKYKDS